MQSIKTMNGFSTCEPSEEVGHDVHSITEHSYRKVGNHHPVRTQFGLQTTVSRLSGRLLHDSATKEALHVSGS